MSRKLARTNTGVLTTAAAERQAREDGQGFNRRGPVVVEIDVGRIVTNPDQPRRHFDEADMEALKSSIAQHGLAQPVGVQQLGDGRFQLVFGERRFRAVRALGHPTIYAITVTGASDELALIENVVRADLSPFEEGDAYARLMERHGYRQEDVGRIVGKDRVDISRALLISRLPQRIRDEYPSHRPARYRLVEIARLKGEGEQLRGWDALVMEMSRRSADEDAPAPAAAKPRSNAVPTGSALPKPLAKAVFGARQTVASVREQGLTLADIDRETLRAIRDDIDAILNAGPNAGKGRGGE
ncbi:ParB/RepB/Spo0J family partition protein [Azospirillum brasilense]|uniref:ParB/RepB/Spo0J family partition protein n=1 Tax=Azospirillum brasilense TaxID=192 RepID=UPI000E688602|nr:ParB/RepB/Spo0J family partition protein [Azospirillum brasilense]NUB28880.1 ParB/RepB/Spo0J family partition protein [Azospirillum brasilense]NUB34571.1 ParB/RepB/Spo0J family partition protein [Azospirillum brasilense]RIW00027.1 ParB/RepB/Spo0J family partition protein [Azospirillum brasilense]